MYHNSADGDAHVGLQVGVLHGNAYVYQAAPAAPPEQKLRVAIHYLQGGSPGEARRRLQALVAEDGMSSAEIAYYWVLSLLSGRSLTGLGESDVRLLDEAFAMADRHPSGRWWRCVAILRMLVNALLDVGPDGQPAAHALSAALHEYAGLPDSDRQDIERHLSHTLSGMAQDHVEGLNAEHVRVERMAYERAVRVPKFFEPDPVPPVAKIARPAAAESTWLQLAGGGAMVLAGAAMLIQAAAATSVIAAMVVFALLAGGGWAVIRHGLERAFLSRRRAAKEAEFGQGSRPAFLGPGGDSLRRDFAGSITEMIDAAFSGQQPREQHLRDAFWRDTHGLRVALQGDMIDLYGVRGTRADAVRWLVHHHADEIACRWREGTLDDFRRRHQPGSMSPALLGGLAALGAAAVVVLLTMNALTVCSLVVAGPLLFFGGRYAHRGGIALYGERRRIALDTAEFDERHRGECAAHERWTQWLADRPTDVEMGRWLSLDIAFWKRAVMGDYRLTNRDILAHLALTEAAPRSRRARDVGGPFRHSAYTVLLFLLTEGGVRQVQARIDFATGVFSAERRTTFRYDAIGSVQVTEVGLRFDDGRETPVVDDYGRPLPQKIVTRQAFQLALVNGQTIRVLLDDFGDEPIDHVRESAERLAELASDAAGVTSALRILEAVAADGRDWIALERQRMYRRLPRQQRMPAPVTYPQLPT
ncbi:hypothetical protein AB0M02_27820 [Actinoplanes sp. NPDC051861]|uniref:hypothetical protein n=1 Tax=Actinoplanes sp. NPDC051861 TaxID=3155170 RepID=UPI0034488CAA